ncbi:chemotaxis protein CheB [Deinococcus peraridilitoris]|uniref:protein-glutamate methylesterase n=1 Tax=Deinococcus peraridilitoris (strain DSM 19664 / LMG 22246 / CIP 109416 / KR-200) TaxID=937777 RepID=L0A6J3_DEIPD|nr:chemotaxis protein CheB [Deinococcus peraridilitoris]AFZ68615.1 chemotaxis response regulator containing a CheY-like receiver domain and a methylesterase domain protein [Deinococcus peraridilitoris DSM 19664]
MSTLPLIVVGASAGGLEPLQELLANLPPNFPAAVFVVLHLAPHAPSRLAEILDRAGPLPALHPTDGEHIRAGRVYVARPDHHLLIEGEQVGMKRGPKENRFRPSVDALFRSAAYTGGVDVIGVVLSGVLDDGTSGLWTIKRLGGLALVQDPAEAQFGAMPEAALQHVEVDEVAPARELAGVLSHLLCTRAESSSARGAEVVMNEEERQRLEMEVQLAEGKHARWLELFSFAEPSSYACPECHGVLHRFQEGSLTRFRCHTGHAYTLNALLSEMTGAISEQLFQALRATNESVLLLGQLARQAREQHDAQRVSWLQSKSREIERISRELQLMLTQSEQFSLDELPSPGAPG